MFSWIYLFSEEILKRGESYKESVRNVKRFDDKILATVKGQNDYYVSVTIKDDKVKDISCNCYYDANCKHEVALLNYIEEHDYLLKGDDEIINRINNLDETALKKILIELSSSDNYKDKILEKLNYHTDIDKKEVKKKLYELMDNYLYDDNDIISDIIFFVEYDIKNIIRTGEYDFAAELLNEIVKTYLIDHGYVNYNSEDILIEQYINYYEILSKKTISKKNRDTMQDYYCQMTGY